MKKRRLGDSLEASAIGLGCMPMTRIYGEPYPPGQLKALNL
jgi:aryl-alcohol dehydrogenase-like predicted oxidoreductase